MGKTKLKIVVALFTMGIGAVAMAADDYYTDDLGGPGGYYFADDITHGWLSGFHGRAGDYNDAVGWRSTLGQEGYMHGGSGGIEYRRTCPSGWAVAGVWARTGRFVDQTQVICRSPDNQQEKWLSKVGGRGGSTAAEARCSDGEFAVGIHGRSGRFLDAIGLICNVDPRP